MVAQQIAHSSSALAPAPDRPRRPAVGIAVVLRPVETARHRQNLTNRHPVVSAAEQLGDVVADSCVEVGKTPVADGDAGEQRERGLRRGVAEEPVLDRDRLGVLLVHQDAVDDDHQRGGRGQRQELVEVQLPARSHDVGVQPHGRMWPWNAGRRGNLEVVEPALRLPERFDVAHVPHSHDPQPRRCGLVQTDQETGPTRPVPGGGGDDNRVNSRRMLDSAVCRVNRRFVM